MVERYPVGRAYTKRHCIRADVTDLDGMRTVMDPLAVSGQTVQGRIMDLERRAAAYLKRANMPLDLRAPIYGDPTWLRENERESLDWYAFSILNTIRMLRKQIERGELWHAVDFALDLGVLATEAKIVGFWIGRSSEGGRESKYSDRKSDQARVRGRDRQAAIELRRKHPTWSVRRIAMTIDPTRERSIRRTIADLKPVVK
jgi:hypothetical protein